MNQHTQQISPTTLQRAQRYTKQISAITELDLPQSGSEDDDETWFNELIGSEATGAHEAAKEAYIQFEEYLKIISPSRQNLKTQSVGEPDLPRTTQPLVTPISAAPCTISGYLWMWFAWTPVPRRWWRLFTMRSGFAPAEHPQCSSYDMTTFGHEDETFTTQFGFEMATRVVGTDSKGW